MKSLATYREVRVVPNLRSDVLCKTTIPVFRFQHGGLRAGCDFYRKYFLIRLCVCKGLPFYRAYGKDT
ncbi:hypothetical protein PHYPO_G00094010 [Pangasianodon hypophthalmus]|uniref:Uncharacterized protein n=1 Tax=Pangasianodon hypophthalmus TaxID=310915 RepID=A0A5N5LBG7_PANHP|nr:hypothetical protein PHYPO_G00094010 [Pangasianodon hypophthalmus]